MKNILKNPVFYIPLIIIILVIGLFIRYFIEKSHQDQQNKLMGEAISVPNRDHLAEGTKITYNSNPPATGAHYVQSQGAGIYTTPPADGHLVHSLEHGAIILWYKPDNLTKDQINQLSHIFNNIHLEKKIMTPRENLDVPIALSSWGRILKLKNIDEKQIKLFFETNYDKGPEQEPI